jgi:carbamoyltransferase
MLTLGVHDGHTATACLLEDGKVLACISEERLNREKEWSGFPRKAILKCLEISSRSAQEIDAVGICSNMPQIGHAHFQNPHTYKKVFSGFTKIVPSALLQSSINIKALNAIGKFMFKSRRDNLINSLSSLGINTEKKYFFEHHLLHAATAYYTNWYKNNRELVVTLDGSGDAVCATINIGENGNIKRVAQVFNYNSICEFYTRITQFLGMKPMSHEYKVMGMAPYAQKEKKEEILNIFRRYFEISKKDPLGFINTSDTWKWGFIRLLRKDLAEKRFDWIAGATQDLFEELILKWVKNAIKLTGVGNLSLSGGGFMNVKLNSLISELPEVDSLFVFPSCGDESNAIGASILAALKEGYPAGSINPLGMLYWGPSFKNSEIEKVIQERLSGKGLKISQPEQMNNTFAEKIASGKIGARFYGRMEWGARALGNRSIIADPRNQKIIHKLNQAIKMRDFWMPFAPTILAEYRNEYLLLREDYHCPFMTIAPDTKERAWKDIPAALHPFDKSARAQLVDASSNPSFYDLVSRFERITGVGGVLNTSFNLHGDPIVCSPDDAINTFLNSSLDLLQLEDFLIEK